MVQNIGDGEIFKLTPDQDGSYVNGTWSELATMPFVSFAAAQAMLADGRVIYEGGEYSDFDFKFLLTNQGAIYDPVADKWTSVSPPSFFVDLYPPRASFAPHPIGDSASVILADGTFMLADKMSRQAALLDLKTMTWTSDDVVSTHFDVATRQESGLSKLEVVANGIASEPLLVLVKSSDEGD